MKSLSKLIVGIESGIVTSVYWLWNTAAQKLESIPEAVLVRNEQVYGPQDGPFNYHQEVVIHQVISMTHPYQSLCIVFGVVVALVGLGYLIYRYH